jgi:hypothetical protein
MIVCVNVQGVRSRNGRYFWKGGDIIYKGENIVKGHIKNGLNFNM